MEWPMAPKPSEPIGRNLSACLPKALFWQRGRHTLNIEKNTVHEVTIMVNRVTIEQLSM